jgi:DNA (cytosine-5)-methyltransferase 1
MNAISLFAGAGGDTTGLQNAGLNVIAFSENNKDAIQTHLKMFPESVWLGRDVKGDITKIPDSEFEEYTGKIKVIFAGFPCFTKGTLILTNNGYKCIEEVTHADKLLTHTNKFQPIVNLQTKLYTGDLISIKIKYHHRPIECTEEHPFYVRTKLRTWNNSTRRYDVTFKSPEWKKAKDITLNDYFGMTVNTSQKIPEFQYELNINKSKTVTESFRIDSIDEWFMLGYFVGDGWIEEGTKQDGRLKHIIRFAINNNDEEYVGGRIRNVIPITDKKVDTGKCKKFGCQNVKWYTVLKQFGKCAHGKRIPEWVQDAPKEMIQEFINGYMKADGSIHKKGSHRISTVSYDLAFGLQRLYLKLGYIFGINKTVRPKTTIIEGRIVNQRDTYTVNGHISQMKHSSFIENEYAWFAPTSITFTEVQNTQVFNFEVETDNSYIVENTIVHNCQGFSNAGKKSVTDPRNKMFYEFLRVVRSVQPEWIIGENVAGLLTKKTDDGESSVIDVIQKEFQEIGYELVFKVYDTSTVGVPQSRKRLIIVGNRMGIQYELPTFSIPKQGVSTIAEESLEGAIKCNLNPPPECVLTLSKNIEVTGTPHPYLLTKLADGRISFGKRDSPTHAEVLDLRKPSKTIICAYSFQPRLYVCVRNTDQKLYIRCLTKKELAQIQGFPASHEFTGNLASVIKQIGNAVPAKLIELVARSVLDAAR